MSCTRKLAGAIAALCLGSCSSPDSDETPIAERASAAFGLSVTRVESAVRTPRFEGCHGKQALVVPPRGSVEIPVTRGFHTLSGEFSICDAVGAEPVEFRAELLTTPPRILFGQPAAVPAFRQRTRFPFLATFFVEEDAPLLLQTIGKSPNVRTGWMDLALTSSPRPPKTTARDDPRTEW